MSLYPTIYSTHFPSESCWGLWGVNKDILQCPQWNEPHINNSLGSNRIFGDPEICAVNNYTTMKNASLNAFIRNHSVTNIKAFNCTAGVDDNKDPCRILEYQSFFSIAISQVGYFWKWFNSANLINCWAAEIMACLPRAFNYFFYSLSKCFLFLTKQINWRWHFIQTMH